ncbi:GNAT family N-acetyltransferase [Tabrizicola sp.]|uniref:GNAT family N-acetyltransferase n=1 Tax=Tabrizicola sp. TaxID=2005166 RepID=UPI003F3789DE
MTVRRATPGDVAIVARLNAHVQGWHATRYPDVFFPNPDPAGLLAFFTDRLADPACTVFLTGDPPVGYALCQLQTREANAFSPPIRRLLIDHVAVAPEARRLGHGRALLQAARDLARDLKADEILLDTWEANHDAHAFFRSEGFALRRMLFRSTP